jgi:hypothetical protein
MEWRATTFLRSSRGRRIFRRQQRRRRRRRNYRIPRGARVAAAGDCPGIGGRWNAAAKPIRIEIGEAYNSDSRGVGGDGGGGGGDAQRA